MRAARGAARKVCSRIWAPPDGVRPSSRCLARLHRIFDDLEVPSSSPASVASVTAAQPCSRPPAWGTPPLSDLPDRQGANFAALLRDPLLGLPLLHVRERCCDDDVADQVAVPRVCVDGPPAAAAPTHSCLYDSRLGRFAAAEKIAAAAAGGAPPAVAAIAIVPVAASVRQAGLEPAPSPPSQSLSQQQQQPLLLQPLPCPASLALPWRLLLLGPAPTAPGALLLPLQSLRLPTGRCGSQAGGPRGLSQGGPGVSLELRSCKSVQQVQEVVDRHAGRMRPLQLAEVVQCLGLMTFGSRGPQRAAARRLAVWCTAKALGAANGGSGGGGSVVVGMDVLKVLVGGWGLLRKPQPELLARILEALVPGSAEGLSAADPSLERMQDQPHPQQVRQGYGRLHTATLRDAAALVQPLAALNALTPPLQHVMVNLAVRRAGNEPPGVVAAAAVSYLRAGVTDPRVAQAFLTALTGRRHGGGGGGETTEAGHIAEALALCNKAGWYDPGVFSDAADALVARGVGDLSLHQIWLVLRAFAGAGHDHPLLTAALATHAKAGFDFGASFGSSVIRSGTGGSPLPPPPPPLLHGTLKEEQSILTAAADPAEVRTPADGGELGNAPANAPGGPGAVAAPTQDLLAALSTLAGLVHGFSAVQVYDRGLYDSLAAGAASLLREAATARLGDANPRALAAALTALLEGYSAGGLPPPDELLAAMTEQQPNWMRSMSVDQVLSLMVSLAAFRYREERLLQRLDEAAATFLENATVAAAAAAGLLTAPEAADRDGAVHSPLGVTPAGEPRADVPGGGRAVPDVSWLPAFLDAACRRLSYPCTRTAAALAAPAAAVVRPRSGPSEPVLRPFTRREHRWGLGPEAETLSRLQLLLLVALHARRGGGGGGGAAAAAGEDPAWFCELMGALACSAARLTSEEQRDLSWALARSLSRHGGLPVGGAKSEVQDAAPGAEDAPAGHDAAAAAQPMPRPRPRRALTAAAAAAALDDAAACHLFRAIVASHYRLAAGAGATEKKSGGGEGGGGGQQLGAARMYDGAAADAFAGPGDGGRGEEDEGLVMGELEAGLHDALTPPVAAALIGRAGRAWHAAGLGTALPQPPPQPPARRRGSAVAAGAAVTAAAAAVPPPPQQQRRLRRGVDAAQSALLSELLRSLGLPVFEQWETSDGLFRVARGVVLPGGQHVGVEVLPDEAFATTTTASHGGTSSTSTSSTSSSGSTSSTSSSGDGLGNGNGDRHRQGTTSPWPVLVGDAAFRARCLAARGWRLVALPAGEWAAAAVAGPAACMVLMRRHSGAL